jgi:hypothetical protein
MAYLGRVKPQETTSSVLRSTYTGNGSTTTYALPGPVANETSIIATINGVTQQDAAYSTDGSNIIFDAAPASGDAIEIRTISAVAMSYAPMAGSVVTGIIADGAVTTGKIADSSITTAKIAAGAVVQADIGTNVAGTGPAFRGTLATNLTVSNSTETQISFNTEQYDTASAYSSGTFTVPVSGYYAVNCFIAWSGDITGYWNFYWKVNGALPYTNAYQIQFTAAAHGVSGSDLLYLTAGQTLTSFVSQQSGSTKYVTAGGETFASIVLVRAA